MRTSGTKPANKHVISYDERLRTDKDWGRMAADAYFSKQGPPHQALKKLVQRLDELEIPYAVCGAMALFEHGYARHTSDVDLLVTAEGLRRIHEALEGLGYVPPFAGSKNLHDVTNNVRIEFLVAGQYPGDGKPKPVAFPDPEHAAIDVGGIKVIQMPRLIELKLASGMTNPGRLKDLADVLEMIKVLKLPAVFVQQLHPYVRGKYDELWTAAQADASNEPGA